MNHHLVTCLGFIILLAILYFRLTVKDFGVILVRVFKEFATTAVVALFMIPQIFLAPLTCTHDGLEALLRWGDVLPCLGL